MRTFSVVGQDSVIGIATCCRLDSSGLESRWGRDLHRSTLALRPIQPPVQWVLGLFLRHKVVGMWD